MNHPDELNHLEARKLLQLALDGHLDDDQVEALDQHLTVCSDCREYALGMTKLDKQLRPSLQLRWPQPLPDESKMASTLAEIQPHVRKLKYRTKTRFSNTIRNLGWVVLAILLVASLAWTIKDSCTHPYPKTLRV